MVPFTLQWILFGRFYHLQDDAEFFLGLRNDVGDLPDAGLTGYKWWCYHEG